MPELIRLEKIAEGTPNIIAVVNWPEYIVPARGYIFDIQLNEIYGGVEEAAQHFLLRTDRKEAKVGEGKLFLLGFVKGRELDELRRYDRDITYMEPVESDGKIKICPFQVKDSGINANSELGNGVRRPGSCNIWEDMIPVIDAEIKNWRKAQKDLDPLGYFSKNLPQIEGMKYKERIKL